MLNGNINDSSAIPSATIFSPPKPVLHQEEARMESQLAVNKFTGTGLRAGRVQTAPNTKQRKRVS